MDKKGENSNTQWLKKLFQKKSDGKKTSIHYVALILCVGVALMILGNFFNSDDSGDQPSQMVFNDSQTLEEDEPAFGQNESREPFSMEDYEYRYENQLREALENIVGVSDVSVMINLAETERKVYEKDVSLKQQQTDETDREGGTRKVEDMTKDEQVVIVRSGDSEEPIVVKTEKPDIRGVLVVARGVDNIQVKSWVVEAVSRVLDVPAHRVSVLPKSTEQSKEE
ncbi:stage III sporulation protein AG [Desertibacillus haloalkaliphilus]|uniref:stage III sporulation protein AG n=1 Tax=Desertibacillus haloalkaliphilus TaxID=1328930 RepID=UPI001C256563|nr:stage III sporulation protein AG [Desertibacillus haloalkaliphilus]MBU8907727.1 stage III sporulation protein AG [Desertibacillus haloalkaliphilus]